MSRQGLPLVDLTAMVGCCAPLAREPLTAEQAVDLARVFKAMGDPVRLRLLSLIASHEGGEACVCDLSEVFRADRADDLPPPPRATRSRTDHR
jgi:ArsR family transcriptional regulator